MIVLLETAPSSEIDFCISTLASWHEDEVRETTRAREETEW
jgi:hypothetical protein